MKVFSKGGNLLYSFLCRASAGVERNKLAGIYAEVDDTVLWQTAKANRIESIVAHTIIDILGENNVHDHWRQAHAENFRCISAYMDELDRIGGILAKEGIPLIALKNGGIARGIYPCPGCCPMGDLDVLVERHQFRQAHQILLEEGYHFEFRSPLEEAELVAAEEGGGAEYWKTLANGDKLWFELQWRPVAGRWIRPDQEPSAEELMARSIPIPETAVRLLSPEDNLLQVALHTAKHSYVRAPGFRLHTDVDRIVTLQKINWNVFVERVTALQVKTAVYFSLLIPFELFGTPIPDWVLERLSPPLWKKWVISKWIQKVGLFNPNEKKFSKPGYVFFNALLYDDLRGLIQAVFPSRSFMKERYGVEGSGGLLLAHMRRLKDLTFRRVNT